MPQQLIFTSNPRGISPGSSGYCTVARTETMRDGLVAALEQISVYEHQVGGFNPVIQAYRILNVRGTSYHVLSRTADSGTDFTHRTNFIAHHIVFEGRELSAISANPAELLENSSLWLEKWEGEPKWTDDLNLDIQQTPITSLPCATWKEWTGDAANAVTLISADAAKGGAGFILPQENSPIRLYSEALRLLAAVQKQESAWGISFTTYLQRQNGLKDFSWKSSPHSDPLSSTVRKASILFDFSSSQFSEIPSDLQNSDEASLARTGRRPFKIQPPVAQKTAPSQSGPVKNSGPQYFPFSKPEVKREPNKGSKSKPKKTFSSEKLVTVGLISVLLVGGYTAFYFGYQKPKEEKEYQMEVLKKKERAVQDVLNSIEQDLQKLSKEGKDIGLSKDNFKNLENQIQNSSTDDQKTDEFKLVRILKQTIGPNQFLQGNVEGVVKIYITDIDKKVSYLDKASNLFAVIHRAQDKPGLFILKENKGNWEIIEFSKPEVQEKAPPPFFQQNGAQPTPEKTPSPKISEVVADPKILFSRTLGPNIQKAYVFPCSETGQIPIFKIINLIVPGNKNPSLIALKKEGDGLDSKYSEFKIEIKPSYENGTFLSVAYPEPMEANINAGGMLWTEKFATTFLGLQINQENLLKIKPAPKPSSAIAPNTPSVTEAIFKLDRKFLILKNDSKTPLKFDALKSTEPVTGVRIDVAREALDIMNSISVFKFENRDGGAFVNLETAQLKIVTKEGKSFVATGEKYSYNIAPFVNQTLGHIRDMQKNCDVRENKLKEDMVKEGITDITSALKESDDKKKLFNERVEADKRKKELNELAKSPQKLTTEQASEKDDPYSYWDRKNKSRTALKEERDSIDKLKVDIQSQIHLFDKTYGSDGLLLEDQWPEIGIWFDTSSAVVTGYNLQILNFAK